MKSKHTFPRTPPAEHRLTGRLRWRLRNLIVRFFSKLPYDRQPISTLLDRYKREHFVYGICGPEVLAGRVSQHSSPLYTYRPLRQLGGNGRSEPYEGVGPRYRLDHVATAYDSTAWALPDSAIIGGEGFIYHRPSRAAVSETTSQWVISGRYSPELAAPRLPPCTVKPGVALCLRARGGDAFYHFLLEGLLRVTHVQTLLERVDHILLTGPQKGWKASWAQAAGIDLDKVIWCTGQTHLGFEATLFTTPLFEEQRPTPSLIRQTNTVFGLEDPAPLRPQQQEGRPILYVSRKDAQIRHWAGEDAFLAQYPQIQAVTLSDLSAEAQIALFASARGIITMHGSALANLVFCRPPFFLIELDPRPGITPMYQRLAEVSGGQSCMIHLGGDTQQELSLIQEALQGYAPDLHPQKGPA